MVHDQTRQGTADSRNGASPLEDEMLEAPASTSTSEAPDNPLAELALKRSGNEPETAVSSPTAPCANPKRKLSEAQLELLVGPHTGSCMVPASVGVSDAQAQR